MRYRRFAPLLFFLILSFSSSLAMASFDRALKGLAGEISKDFPPMEGRILGVKGKRALINLGKKEGVSPGMVFTIFRRGEPFYHPITGVLLGYTEKELGVIQISRVYEEASQGEVWVKEEVKPGDGVRISLSRINLYLFPLIDKTGEGFNLMAFTERLRRHLEETGRFNIYGEERVILTVSSATQEGFMESLSKMVRDRKARGVALLGSIVKEEGDYYFHGGAISLDTGKRVDSFDVYLGKGGWKPAIEQDLLLASPNMRENGLMLGVGDVDGDGVQELLMATKARVDVYKVDLINSKVQLLSSFPLKPQVVLLTLDVVDLDGDGKAEVVYSYSDITLFAIRSDILSYIPEKKKWERLVTGKEFLLRGFSIDNTGVMLGQSISKEDPLAFPPFLARYNGGIKKERKLSWLRGDIVCGAQIVDLGEHKSMGILVNEKGRLILKELGTGELLGDLNGTYANSGLGFFFRQPVAKSFYTGEEWINEKDYIRYADDTIAVPGRSIMFENRGGIEMATFLNNPGGWAIHFSPFERGKVRLYRWRDGYFEDANWQMEFDGGIMDLQVSDIDKNGEKELVVLVKKGRKGRKGNFRYYTRFFIYRVPR